MRLDLWQDEYDEIRTDDLPQLKAEYKSQIDRTPFETIMEKLEGTVSPDFNEFEKFTIPKGNLEASVRVDNGAGLLGMYVTTELPEDFTEAEAVLRALVEISKEYGNLTETTHLKNKQEATVRLLVS